MKAENLGGRLDRTHIEKYVVPFSKKRLCCFQHFLVGIFDELNPFLPVTTRIVPYTIDFLYAQLLHSFLHLVLWLTFVTMRPVRCLRM